jgi:hypothetical protein
MRIDRRAILGGIGLVATSGATVFASGAFTQVEADRTFDVGLAGDDSQSQLVIEENDELGSSAIQQTDDGAFSFNAQNVAPNALTTYGSFSDVTEPGTLETGAFVIRNENDTGTNVDVTAGISVDGETSAPVDLALLPPSDDSEDVKVASADGEGDTVTVSEVPSTETDDGVDPAQAEIECGVLVDTTSDVSTGELGITLDITAVRSDS